MSQFVQVILETIWLLLPAGFANMAPVFATKYNWFSRLNRPVYERLLGAHKTWRGFVIGILFAFIAGYIQYLALRFDSIQAISLVSFASGFDAALLGAWIGFGGLAGDSIKSFLKRQLKIAPGKPWRPWDQIDLAIGGIVAAAFFVPLTILHVIVAVVATFLISYSGSAIGVALKMKSSL